jgi:hypothetical protein
MRSPEIILEPNNNYELIIDVKIENVKDSFTRVEGLNISSGNWESITDIPFVNWEKIGLAAAAVGTFDWKEYRERFSLPEGISNVRLILASGKVVNTTLGNATTWFDDIRIINDTDLDNYKIDMIVLYKNSENMNPEEMFNNPPVAQITSYKRIDATKYEVRGSSSAPFVLGFAAAYDEFWIARINGEKTSRSIPLYATANGFYINITGDFLVVIEYEPQKWFTIGMSITGISIVGSLGYLIGIERNRCMKGFTALSGKLSRLGRLLRKKRNAA